MGQLIVSRAQIGMFGRGAEPRIVDQGLGMLDAKADGERLGLDIDAPIIEHLEGVAGAVADGQDHMIGQQVFTAFQHHAAYLALAGGVGIDQEVHDLVLKPIFPAQFLDRLAQALDHRNQSEGANMGMGLGEDFWRRTGLDELGQDLAAKVPWILDLAIELAVGEGSGAALAILNIGLRIEHLTAP